MARFAAFDVGTNTVLMAVADRREDGGLETVAERADITRLGEGVDASRTLKPAAMERTAAVIARFADEARALGATAFAAGATSAARDAINRDALIDLVRRRAGVELEILEGELEARLTFRAVQEDFASVRTLAMDSGPSWVGGSGSWSGAADDGENVGAATLCAIDIGGGSTEVVMGPARGAPSFRKSLNVGSVRLTERFVSAHPIPTEDQVALRAELRRALSSVPPPEGGCDAVAVAATATTLFAMSRGLRDPREDALHGGVVTVDALEAWVPKLCGMSLEERRQVPGLDPRRADVICAGGFILWETLLHLGADHCRVSDRGVRWGLLHERFGDKAARG